MIIMDKLFLDDGQEVTVIGFGEDNLVAVGYYNILGEYVRRWVSRDRVHIRKEAVEL